MQTALAKFISILFHPLIMPPVGMLLLFNAGTYLEFLSYPQKRAIFLILFIGTTVLPLSLLPVLHLNRLINNLKMEDRRERLIPLLVTVVFYLITWYMLSRLNVPGLIRIYAITASLTVIMCALVNIKWKISLHMTALGAIAGMLLAIAFRFGINLQLYLVLGFFAGGLAGWARLTLRAHTPQQVYAGYLGGLAIAFFMMFTF